jgi:hypothetical protein
MRAEGYVDDRAAVAPARPDELGVERLDALHRDRLEFLTRIEDEDRTLAVP